MRSVFSTNSTKVPLANKNFVTLVSDNHGQPALKANHMAPVAWSQLPEGTQQISREAYGPLRKWLRQRIEERLRQRTEERRDRPDWIYMQGWGAMNPTALKEASKIGFPMNRLVGVWWAGGEDDVRPAGELAKGYSSLNFSGVGQNFPAIQDILKYVVDKGKSQVASRDKVGENLYNRGVMNAVLITEAIRAAQRLTDKKQVSGDDVRRGLETLSITDARWKELGLSDFAAPIHLSCSDHDGHNGIYLVEWDGTKWTKASGWIEPIKDKVLPLIESAASSYVSANAGWPKRTEACDKSS